MKLLLDTHTLLWLVENNPQLSQTALDLLVDPGNELLLSPATYWELAIKISIRKYQLTDPLADYIAEAVQLYGLTILQMDVKHAEAIVTLPHHHKDPFDRMLIAQSIVENVALVSSDEAFDAYPIQRLW
ncbi:MAG: type II toxin-antitoxin system VapC family toxin [Planctomycetota bacterium]|nr:type II toxin-antitoxin system VapC family toxin [Planctomycetota bacterium]